MMTRFSRNLLALCLGLLLGGASTWASAATGAFYKGVCYPTVQEAISQFSSQFPIANGGGTTGFVTTFETFPPPDFMFRYATVHYDLNGVESYTESNWAEFQTCTLEPDSIPLDLSATTDPHLILIIAAVILFGIGFNSGRT